jgi:hypothetical protein
MPIFRCDISTSGDHTEKIDITDTSSNKLIGSIVPSVNEIFTKKAAYFVDITFNGNLAILLPLERSANYVRFLAYVWDSGNQNFTEIPSFSEIQNPCINEHDKLIYSMRSADGATSYAMFDFNNNKFALKRTFSYWRAESEINAVSNAGQLMHCKETSGSDVKNVIKDFFVPNGSDIDMNDERIKLYFEKGSLWDLNSSKWKCEFYNELK